MLHSLSLVTFFVVLLSVTVSAQQPSQPLRIDADFPGGNVTIGTITGDVVDLKPDLRDTRGQWFYWCFRVNGAQGRTLTFNFTAGEPVGVRSAAISLDSGDTWKWLGQPADKKSFTYAFPADAGEIRFSFGMPYTQRHLDAFLKSIGPSAYLKTEPLCQSRKGRSVERLHVGKLDGEPRFRVLITCRAHACEMMTSYSAEGIIQAALADDARGKWFRDNVEMVLVPFVDKDGVEDGDQGKNRQPRDHNRDYDAGSLYPETRALQQFAPKWSAGKRLVTLDLHCPHIRGDVNEKIYLVGQQGMEAKGQRFSEILERTRKGPLVYQAADNVPFGTLWNTAANFTAGMNASRWAASLPGIDLACTFELPYANAKGVEVNADSARAFGKDLATAIKEYLE